MASLRTNASPSRSSQSRICPFAASGLSVRQTNMSGSRKIGLVAIPGRSPANPAIPMSTCPVSTSSLTSALSVSTRSMSRSGRVEMNSCKKSGSSIVATEGTEAMRKRPLRALDCAAIRSIARS